MIPLRDTNPTAGTPIVNRLLILVNVAAWVYVLTIIRSPGELDAFYTKYAFDWSVFTSRLSQGELAIGTFIPLFTHMFLHGGWLHILGNMLYLWIFGDNVEDRLGHGRYLVFYLACGVIAAAGQGLIQPSPMVGASGAIAGVLGAYIVLFPAAQISTLVFLGIFISVVRLPALLVIGFFVVVQFLDGLAQVRVSGSESAEQVAYFAHIVGFFAGVVLIIFVRPSRGLAARR